MNEHTNCQEAAKRLVGYQYSNTEPVNSSRIRLNNREDLLLARSKLFGYYFPSIVALSIVRVSLLILPFARLAFRNNHSLPREQPFFNARVYLTLLVGDFQFRCLNKRYRDETHVACTIRR